MSPLGVYRGSNVEIISYNEYNKAIDPIDFKWVIESPFFERAKEQFDIKFLKVDNGGFTSGERLRVNIIHYALRQGGSKHEGPRHPLEENYENSYLADAINFSPRRLMSQYKHFHCRGDYTCSALSPNDGIHENLPAMRSISGFIKYKDGAPAETYCFNLGSPPQVKSKVVIVDGKRVNMNIPSQEYYLRRYTECFARSFGYSKYAFGPAKFEGIEGLSSLFAVKRRAPWGAVELSEEEIVNTINCLSENRGFNE
ncbi:MAG: hypothetical protein COA43_15070 [Robiginitomaculum sp.]|nr:MAG: hypothetical protein COA43_15070 [Robiginitomaculum sp.]